MTRPMFGQTFDTQDLALVGLLVVLEGVMSIDNALVLGLLARRLPRHLQSRALTYGLVGAFAFRLIAVGLAAYLLHWRVVKLLGGAYLLWVGGKHFVASGGDTDPDAPALDRQGKPIAVDEATGLPLTIEQVEDQMVASTHGPHVFRGDALDYAHAASTHTPAFWVTVGSIELTDVAFAVDSILAAIAVVGSPREGTPAGATHPKLWVVVVGGMLGVVLMRFAAVLFIKLLHRFPRFETAAYLLVIVIGAKLVADWHFNTADHPHRVNFHSPGDPAFWAFWIAMTACFAVGFLPKRPATARPAP